MPKDAKDTKNNAIAKTHRNAGSGSKASNNMLAFATKSGDYLYAVLYTIKLDSDDTYEAWDMIPKTLYVNE